MKYEKLKKLRNNDFKRLTGVNFSTFQEMVLLAKEHILRTKKTGRVSKLIIEDQVLLTLDYHREYRTYFHLGQDYGLHESNVCRTIEKIESILVQSKEFKLPGKKALSQADENGIIPINQTVIDVTETQIERPKKKQKKSYSGKKKLILSKLK